MALKEKEKSAPTPDFEATPLNGLEPVYSHLSEARRRAWETRRKKYGPRGHNSSYSRPELAAPGPVGMLNLLIDLHLSAVVSEGQLAKATGLDRVTLRCLIDQYCEQTGKQYAPTLASTPHVSAPPHSSEMVGDEA